VIALAGHVALKYYSASLFLFGLVLLYTAFATEPEDAFDSGVFLLHIILAILGIACVAASIFALILEVFTKL
jgi:hypothetical protein